jgi:hypothetical protein
MKTLLGILAGTPVALFTLGWGAMSMQPPEYAIARGLVAAASASAVIWYITWLFVIEEPFWARVLLGAGIGFVALGGLPFGLDWISQLEARNSPTQKDARLAMARQWIRLADDISADLPPLRHSFEPPFAPSTGMTPELWKQQFDRSQRALETLMDSMRAKYRGRIVFARDEMLRVGISLNKDNLTDRYLEDPTLSLVNSFSFQQWANKLNIEGRGVLSAYGVSE